MARFNRDDLQRQYSWSADGGDNPRLRGNPDSSLLDRTEGYEVLYMINWIMEDKGLWSTADGRKIERLIHECPGHYRSQANIRDWIYEAW